MNSVVNDSSNLVPPTYAPATSKLIKHLRGVDHYDLISYDVLSTIAGKDVRATGPGSGRHNLKVAMDALEREGYASFVCISGQGIKRLADGEMPDESEGRRRSLRRKATKAARLLQCCKIENLDDGERRRILTNMAQVSLAALFTNNSSHKKIEASTNGIKILPDAKKMLRLFT